MFVVAVCAINELFHKTIKVSSVHAKTQTTATRRDQRVVVKEATLCKWTKELWCPNN